MIFLSHNSKDKPLVDQFAARLLKKYGESQVFYDTWSIKPGESIIGSMDRGLSQTDKFVLFISKNSLNSGMVTLEWQTALSQKSGGNMDLIPVKVDDVQIPMILSQLKYIDLYTNGLEVAVQQLDDVLGGSANFVPTEFHNLEVKIKRGDDSNQVEVTVVATTFQEPISRFFIAFDGAVAQMNVSVMGESMINTGDNDLTGVDGRVIKAKYVGIARAITPSFPMKIQISNVNGANVIGVFQPVGSETNELKPIPIKYLTTNLNNNI